jgi:hypothetical protein
MKKVRITEFEDWGECPWKWDYKWQRRLVRNDPSGSAIAPIVGSAIHFGMESGLTDREAVLSAARLYIQANHPEQTVAAETKLAVAVGNMPWDALSLLYPVTEQLISVTYGEYEVVGKPDLYGLLPTGQILVTDFKTTGSKGYQWSNKLQVESTYNLQLPFYAVLLADYYKTSDVFYQHIIVSTEKRGLAWVEEPKMIAPILEQTRGLMLEKARSVGSTTAPSEGWHCLYCPYRDIDEIRLTGGDWEYEIETNWHRRVDRQANVVINLEPEKGGENES